jgi:CRP/FNR family transcriptional regulator
MSNEIVADQEMILLLSKKNAEERLAAFIYGLSQRFSERGFSPREFRLTMTRGDIGNYLGLTVETISRLLGRFQKADMIAVKGKYISINDRDALRQLAGTKNS